MVLFMMGTKGRIVLHPCHHEQLLNIYTNIYYEHFINIFSNSQTFKRHFQFLLVESYKIAMYVAYKRLIISSFIWLNPTAV